jgi:hypothetical protein
MVAAVVAVAVAVLSWAEADLAPQVLDRDQDRDQDRALASVYCSA